MTEVHFVFEKPQKPERPAEKKRSRLVTSCDACRSRKIKCRPSGYGDDVCEACQLSGSECLYFERDRIRAERGIANFTVAPAQQHSSSSKSLILSRASRGSSKSSSRSISSSTKQARGDKRPVEPELQASTSQPQHYPIDPFQDTATLAPPLFDPDRRNYPHQQLEFHFVRLFFTYVGGKLPFMNEDDVVSDVLTGNLHPAIANGIAAFAVRFSNRVSHMSGSRFLTGEPYLEAAKSFIPVMDMSSLECLHVLLLIAWAESGAGRSDGLWHYGRMAVTLAMELNLGSEETIMLQTSEKLRNQLRKTFWAVVWLDLVSSSSVGKTPLFRLEACTTAVPLPARRPFGSSTRVLLYRALKTLYIMMNMLNGVSNGAPPSNPYSPRDSGLMQLRAMITAFRRALPDALALSSDNMRQAEVDDELHDFVLVHLLMNSLSVVVHCPALFWRSQPDGTLVDLPQVAVSWSSARAIIDTFLMLREVDDRAIVASSSFYLPLSIARGAFLLEREYAEWSWTGYASQPYSHLAQSNQVYLNQCQGFMAKMGTVWGRVNAVQINSQSVALFERPRAYHYRPAQFSHSIPDETSVSHYPSYSQDPQEVSEFYSPPESYPLPPPGGYNQTAQSVSFISDSLEAAPQGTLVEYDEEAWDQLEATTTRTADRRGRGKPDNTSQIRQATH